MLRSLRNRLIFSHVILLLVVIPVVGLILIYVLETRFLLPNLARNLVSDARLLAEINRAEYEAWGTPLFFPQLLSRVGVDSAKQVMILDNQGQLLYSSDSNDASLLGAFLTTPGVQQASLGHESAYTNYSILRMQDTLIDTYAPIITLDGVVIGIVRVTYRVNSLIEVLNQLRLLTGSVLLAGLLLGGFLGWILALSISRPVQKVTNAIYNLARGESRVHLDITGPEEIRSQVRAVNFLVDRLNSLEQARNQLLANLVHELGRPLGALRAAIHALSKGAGNDPQLLADLTHGMDDETAHLQRTLEDLARLHDEVLGNLELKRQSIQLGEWLPVTLSAWEQAAREKALEWCLNIQSGLPILQADPDRLAQMVGNLVSNAIKYTPNGGKITITALEEPAGKFQIRIQDTGVGIKPDDQVHLFEPFFRGDQGKHLKEGLGLGLTIARDLAVAHGGTLEFNSQPGLGSVFIIYLPV